MSQRCDKIYILSPGFHVSKVYTVGGKRTGRDETACVRWGVKMLMQFDEFGLCEADLVGIPSEI